MTSSSLFIYGEDELQYKFGEGHPFNPIRLALTVDLLRELQAVPDRALMRPVPVDESVLHAVHERRYIDAVKWLGSQDGRDDAGTAEHFGLSAGDTPAFPHMHKITSLVVGGSVLAAEQVMSDRAPHALHLAGGLHHAMPNKAAGFCIYNDAGAAIRRIRDAYRAKVLYVDTDVHHGDGVQFMFYDDPDVCTLSFHETGKFLFPGTGSVAERGNDHGFGFSVNMPFEPYTEDESWIACFREIIEAVVDRFRPDVIISQHGCDAHAFDPLSHMQCSMAIYRDMPDVIHRLAHAYCDGRWVALGGGGYDIWRVVPRAWSLLWLVMIDHPLAASVLSGHNPALPTNWIDRWSEQSPKPLCRTWMDNRNDWEPVPRRDDITRTNVLTKQKTLLYMG